MGDTIDAGAGDTQETQAFVGSANRFTGGGSLSNALNFMIDNKTSQMAICHLCKVVALVEGAGGVSKAPMVKVKVLTQQVDGQGNPSERAIIYNVPAMRLQAGKNAIIIDPKVDDMGLLVVCQSDISAVKENKDYAPPGSYRQNNWADGCYIPAFIMDGAITSYVQIVTDGSDEGVINVITPKKVNVTNQDDVNVTSTGKLNANITGDITLHTSGNLIITAANASLTSGGLFTTQSDVIAGGVAGTSLQHHLTSAVSSGTSVSGPPIPI